MLATVCCEIGQELPAIRRGSGGLQCDGDSALIGGWLAEGSCNFSIPLFLAGMPSADEDRQAQRLMAKGISKRSRSCNRRISTLRRSDVSLGS